MLTQVTYEYGIHLCELSLDPIRLIGHPPFIFDQWDIDSGDIRVRDPPVRSEPGSYPPDWSSSFSFWPMVLTQVTDEYGIHLCELSLYPISLIGQPVFLFWPMRCWQVTDEYGIHLCELSLDPSGQLTLRQLSALLLKQYIDAHWSQVQPVPAFRVWIDWIRGSMLFAEPGSNPDPVSWSRVFMTKIRKI